VALALDQAGPVTPGAGRGVYLLLCKKHVVWGVARFAAAMPYAAYAGVLGVALCLIRPDHAATSVSASAAS
jgi:hypothetical protein